MPPTKRELWRLDAEHHYDEEHSFAMFFFTEAGAIEQAEQRHWDEFYCDVYRVEVLIDPDLVGTLVDGKYPNVRDEEIIASIGNPFAKAQGDLARIKATKKRKK